MPTVIKVLGQEAPGATSEVDLYEVPSGAAAVISTITICNRGAPVAYFRISVSIGGVSTDDPDYIYFDVPLDPNDTFAATFGVTLGEGDVVRAYSSTGNLTFQIFGEESVP